MLKAQGRENPGLSSLKYDEKSTVAKNKTTSRFHLWDIARFTKRSRICRMGEWERQGTMTFLGKGWVHLQESGLLLRKEWRVQRTDAEVGSVPLARHVIGQHGWRPEEEAKLEF